MSPAEGSWNWSRRFSRVSLDTDVKGTLAMLSLLWAKYRATMGDFIGVSHRTDPVSLSSVRRFPVELSVKCTNPGEKKEFTLVNFAFQMILKRVIIDHFRNYL